MTRVVAPSPLAKETIVNRLESDYPSVLLAQHEPPCLSLYQPTHRRHPENQQDPILFRNLLKVLDVSLRQDYRSRDVEPLLAPFHALANDREFWNHALDGLAVLGTSGLFLVYKLQRTVPERAIVAASFHTKPLLRILQSADRFRILGLNRREACLFEGNRDTLAEVDVAPGVSRMTADAAAAGSAGMERTTRVYGSAAPGATTRHGTDVQQDALDNDTARFFREVDRAIMVHQSRSASMPLLLAALPEHHHLFRQISQNLLLGAVAIDIHPDDLSIDALRERAWQLILPRYLHRLATLTDAFGVAKSRGLGSDNIGSVAQATVAGRVATVLIEAERMIPGSIDAAGAVTLDDSVRSEVDDVLDDLGERVLRTGGEVVVVPAERMPASTGIAAIYRF